MAPPLCLAGWEGQLPPGCWKSGTPAWLHSLLTEGILRTLGWVISAMPPMAIFFPMFTLLEDSGYLPRIAFNLDRCFKKQAPCESRRLLLVWDSDAMPVG